MLKWLSSIKSSLGLLLLPSLAFAKIPVTAESVDQLPIFQVSLVSPLGSFSDPKDKIGLTYTATELLLRGTQKLSKKEFFQAVDQTGGSLDFKVEEERITLTAKGLSEQLEPLLDLLLEALTAPKLAPQELEQIKLEALAGFQSQLEEDASLSFDHLLQMIFAKHPFAHLSSGYPSTLALIRSQDIVEHLKLLLNPSHLKIFGCKKISQQALQLFAQKLEMKLKASPLFLDGVEKKIRLEAPEVYFDPTAELRLIDKPGITQAHIYFAHRGITRKDPQFFPLWIANNAFGGPGSETILMKEIREKHGWSYGIESFFSLGKKPKFWSVYLFPSNLDAPQALQRTFQLIENLQKKGISRKTFEFSKASLIAQSAFLKSTPETSMNFKIIEQMDGLEPGFFDKIQERLENVRFEEVQKAFHEFLNLEQLKILILCDVKKLKTKLLKKKLPYQKFSILPFQELTPESKPSF